MHTGSIVDWGRHKDVLGGSTSIPYMQDAVQQTLVGQAGRLDMAPVDGMGEVLPTVAVVARTSRRQEQTRRVVMEVGSRDVEHTVVWEQAHQVGLLV